MARKGKSTEEIIAALREAVLSLRNWTIECEKIGF